MTLAERLVAFVATAPPDAMVPVRWLSELIDAETAIPLDDSASVSAGVDLTVAQVAAKFGRGVSTVRTWLARGDLDGAYRLHGREWRIPPAALATMQQAEGKRFRQQRPIVAVRRPSPLGAWRQHMPGNSHA